MPGKNAGESAGKFQKNGRKTFRNFRKKAEVNAKTMRSEMPGKMRGKVPEKFQKNGRKTFRNFRKKAEVNAKTMRSECPENAGENAGKTPPAKSRKVLPKCPRSPLPCRCALPAGKAVTPGEASLCLRCFSRQNLFLCFVANAENNPPSRQTLAICCGAAYVIERSVNV
jgi:hypothetical protein